jgi:hypothetical protein
MDFTAPWNRYLSQLEKLFPIFAGQESRAEFENRNSFRQYVPVSNLHKLG